MFDVTVAMSADELTRVSFCTKDAPSVTMITSLVSGEPLSIGAAGTTNVEFVREVSAGQSGYTHR